MSIILLLSTLLSAHAAAPVPAVLYHFGDQAPLLQDAIADTVPANIWNRFIMGADTRYAQKPYRRGLYGTSHPAYSSYYGDLFVGQGKRPWMMAIQVAERCREPSLTIDLSELPDEPRFVTWFSEASSPEFASLNEFVGRCYGFEAPGSSVRSRHLNAETITGDSPENDCEKLVDRYLSETGVVAVVDSEWDQSWYLRDRSCIASIDGTAHELLETAATLPGWFRDETPEGGLRESYWPKRGSSLFLILVQALVDEPAIDPELLARVRTAASGATFYDPPFTKTRRWMAEDSVSVIDSYSRCAKPELDQASETFLAATRAEGAWMPDRFDAALKAYLARLAEICPVR